MRATATDRPSVTAHAAAIGAEPDGNYKTLAEELRLQVADEIISGALKPGTTLDETVLARRFQVSRTPVREAIRLLSASGLVQARAHRSAIVARPSAEFVLSMFEAMAELEALCAGLSAERMNSANRRMLEQAHEDLRALICIGDPQRYCGRGLPGAPGSFGIPKGSETGDGLAPPGPTALTVAV